MARQPLAPFPDDAFSRVLCAVAHPDDVEYGTSSAVAAWTSKGIEVGYLLLTRGEAGIDTMDPKATAELRVREQIKGSHEVGVTRVEFLEYPDGVLEYSLSMRRDIARAIRSFRPDALVVSPWDVEFPIGLNQADHRVAGLAAVDAMRDAGNRWVFPELLAEGLEPHSTRWLLTNGFENGTHGVDVSGEPLERGIASLEAHAEYLAIGAKRMWGMTTVFRRITSRHRHQPSTSHRLAGEHAMPQDRLAPVAALTQARGRFILL